MRCAGLNSRAPGAGLYSLVHGFFAPEQIVQLLGLERVHLQTMVDQSLATSHPHAANGTPEAHQFNYLEMKRYLHDQLLRDADTFSMAHAIELRVPYLDHTLVDYVRPLAAARRVNKPLLVQAVGEPALTEVGQAKKQGFTFPFGEWRGQHAGTFEEIALRADGLDRHTVQRLWRAFRVGRLHWSRAWALVVLGAQG